MTGKKGTTKEQIESKDVVKRPRGYEKLVVWRNAKKLRKLVYDLSARFSKAEYRRTSQMRDAARSVKQNIQEGYKRANLGEYIHFLRISRGSLGELKGDIEDSFEDNLIDESEFKELDKLCGTTDYLFERLLTSLEKKRKDGSWIKFPC